MTAIHSMTDTWNSGGQTFDAIKMNVTDSASQTASKLINLQVGGSTKFGVQKDGSLAATGDVAINIDKFTVAASSGNTAVAGTLAVTGASTLTGAVTSAAAVKSTGDTAGVGYGTGAGGAVTQATNRTTGVTLNKVTGAITLVSAAGSATPFSFTVTNSAVAATDVILLSQKSGTDKYVLLVTAVGAGSFQITAYTTGGTTTEQPVINFAVIKGVAA